jgi:hypothetical protein
MSYENKTGIGVFSQYGARTVGTSVGLETSNDSIQKLSIEFSGTSLQDSFLPPLVIPKGAHFLRYVLTVHEAFNITGTTPTVIFGGTAPATNGVVLTEAELEAVGSKVPASAGAGTWSTTSATGTSASEKVTFALGGTTPVVVTGVGKATLTAEYIYKNRQIGSAN